MQTSYVILTPITSKVSDFSHRWMATGGFCGLPWNFCRSFWHQRLVWCVHGSMESGFPALCWSGDHKKKKGGKKNKNKNFFQSWPEKKPQKCIPELQQYPRSSSTAVIWQMEMNAGKGMWSGDQIHCINLDRNSNDNFKQSQQFHNL